MQIGIAILTYNARNHLAHCLSPLLASPLRPRILVIDSSSTDGTIEEARKYPVETLVIPKNEFNHGLTREKARKYLNTDIVIMMTQDAYATNKLMVERLVEPIITKKASVSYARQIPHEGANFFESFPREFNYPSRSHIRDIHDLPIFGVYTFFCSDSCAAYLNRALDEVGGFKRVLFGEDTLAVAELLHRGHKIAYVAEAIVKHSHCYTLIQEFKRNFDIGLSRHNLRHLIDTDKGDEKRGRKYLAEMTSRLSKDQFHQLPYAYMQTLVKWIGYRSGKASVKAPNWVKKTFSSQPHYWE